MSQIGEAENHRLRDRLTAESNILNISKLFLLRRKSFHFLNYTPEDETTLAAIERGLSVRRAHLSLLNSAELRWLAKFSPDQPRVPAGQREGGQWTADGGGTPTAGDRTSDGEAPDNNRRVDVSSGPEGSATHTTVGDTAGDIQFVGMRTIVTIDYSKALTGISTIDNATKALSETLGKTMESVDFIPKWTPQIYGTAVHVDFAAQVRYQGILGINPSDVEQSYFNKDPADYGDPGSVRTDVILRNEVGDIIAIYDVKTGGAVLTAARVQQLRDHTGVGLEVPVIELQVNRGASIKGSVRRKHIGAVTALLWNPVHRGSAGRGASA